ncbi:MAG: hypothetical protein UY18_C0002G0039 [Microgenomates group bacterium GW2011_GWF2_47_9]|nr:MAG: hypothetical protein UY18_C0002G0039 [Microgenomates group bacterium GW2011_GWF2_47_9]
MADIDFDQITTPGAYDPAPGADKSAYASAIEKLISNVLVVLTIVAGIAFILYFLIGGLTWITAGGQKDKVESAKAMMTNGAIGLIIVAVSYMVVWIVGKALGLNILEPAEFINSMTFK